jgi:glycosyltransferase involved in cell wall biosynthesis
MPELILHKKTGFLVHSMEQAVQAVEQVSLINRKDCRQWSASAFSSQKMTEDYITVYNRILHL